MVFHCLSVPYSPTKKDVSLCAFVQKVYKFCKEMTERGHTVYHYGLPDSKVACTEHINVVDTITLKNSYGDLNTWKSNGFNQNTNTQAVKTFNNNCITELNKRVKSQPNEFILCWFGYAHEPCVKHFYNKSIIVEPSIGYDSMFAPVKIFETYSHMHKMHGFSQKSVNIEKEFVVYPGFDPEDFQYSAEKSDEGLFLGRIIEAKGVELIYKICNQLKQKMNFAGPNILNLPETKYCKFLGFVDPNQRKKLLSKAKFLFAPSLFIEPCNWTVIEAQFSGTPTITTDFGGFTETVKQGITGFRCETKNDFIKALKNLNEIQPRDCYANAIEKYTIKNQMNRYEKIFHEFKKPLSFQNSSFS
jgi:glycosyltransferase involved in cell wall biosynthesis